MDGKQKKQRVNLNTLLTRIKTMLLNVQFLLSTAMENSQTTVRKIYSTNYINRISKGLQYYPKH